MKFWIASHHVMMCFVCCHSFVYRHGTHVAQKYKEEVMGESVDFMNLIWPQLQRLDINMAYVIYIDQTAVFYSMHENKMLEPRGTCAVHIKSSKDKRKGAQ